MIQVPAWAGSGEGPLAGLLCPPTAERSCGVSLSSSKGTNPIIGAHPHDLIKPSNLPEAPPPDIITSVTTTSTYKLAGGGGSINI